MTDNPKRQGGYTLDAPEPARHEPLLPFEQGQLRALTNQFNAAPQRVRDEFLRMVVGLQPNVVPLRKRP